MLYRKVHLIPYVRGNSHRFFVNPWYAIRVMKKRKKVQYANPLLHVVRKRAMVLAVQLQGEESLATMSSLYLNVVDPNSFGEEDSFRLLSFDKLMGVLTFECEEKPLELVIGDWLVYDGDELSVVSNEVFESGYRVTVRHNKKEKDVRSKKGKLKAARAEAEYQRWEF